MQWGTSHRFVGPTILGLIVLVTAEMAPLLAAAPEVATFINVTGAVHTHIGQKVC